MKSFFLIASKDGRAIPDANVRRFRDVVERTIVYAPHRTQLLHRSSPLRSIHLMAVSNETDTRLVVDGDGALVALSGDCEANQDLARLRADSDLSAAVSEISGRFSVAVVDLRAELAAVANTAARIDPVFLGESDAFHYVGTQASTIGALVHGDVRYDVESLYSFANTGFYGTDRTCFEGVRVLGPASTWLVEDGEARCFTTAFADFKARGLEDAVDACAEALLGSVSHLARASEPVTLGLSGGKDSRLVLVALLRAGVDVKCFTIDRGAANAADVYLARLLAEKTGVPLAVRREMQVSQRGQQSELDVDLLKQTATTLRATDGAVFGHDRVRFDPSFRNAMTLVGLGGEVMRGGYAEGNRDIDADRARAITLGKFSRFGQLFRPEVVARYEAEIGAWLDEQLASLGPIDVLDCLYVAFRCGRWIAGTSRAATMSGPKLYPFLDNRLATAMVRVAAQDKLDHRLIRAVMRRMHPAAAELPLAEEHWGEASADERARLEEAHPQAFAAGARGPDLDWRNHLAPPLLTHIREYCLDSGRIDALSAAIDLDACRNLLRSPEAAQPSRKRAVFGLYSACVLTSGDWLRSPVPSAPLRVVARDRGRPARSTPREPVRRERRAPSSKASEVGDAATRDQRGGEKATPERPPARAARDPGNLAGRSPRESERRAYVRLSPRAACVVVALAFALLVGWHGHQFLLGNAPARSVWAHVVVLPLGAALLLWLAFRPWSEVFRATRGRHRFTAALAAGLFGALAPAQVAAGPPRPHLWVALLLAMTVAGCVSAGRKEPASPWRGVRISLSLAAIWCLDPVLAAVSALSLLPPAVLVPGWRRARLFRCILLGSALGAVVGFLRAYWVDWRWAPVGSLESVNDFSIWWLALPFLAAAGLAAAHRSRWRTEAALTVAGSFVMGAAALLRGSSIADGSFLPATALLSVPVAAGLLWLAGWRGRWAHALGVAAVVAALVAFAASEFLAARQAIDAARMPRRDPGQPVAASDA